MEITTPADLAACPAGTVVLDGHGIAWQSMPYMPHHWFATGSEVEKTPQQLMQSGPLRVIHNPASPARATAYDRYRPTVEIDSGNQRPALDCTDCRNWEGWPGVRVWAAPEHAAVDLADLIAAADVHERAEHPTGCRCDPHDCGHTEED